MAATAESATPKKKAAKKMAPKASAVLPEDVDGQDDAPVVPLVQRPKVNKAKPGTEGFDWQLEYPREEVYVYTAPSGMTIGLTRLGPDRKPKPGLLRRLHREGGMSVMWYFIELASSPASLKLQEELDEDEYTAMLRGWADFAGIELSE